MAHFLWKNYALWRYRNNFSINLLQIENLEELLKEKDNQVEIARSKLSAVQAQTYSSEGALSSLEEALADRDKQVNKPLDHCTLRIAVKTIWDWYYKSGQTFWAWSLKCATKCLWRIWKRDLTEAVNFWA